MKIIRLGNLSEDIYGEVGGKARGLDLLKKQGYTIADGFVVTDISEIGEAEYQEIEKAFDGLGAIRVSVRSSASNEDGGDFSNAGQYETCLDVTREELRAAVDKCMSSLCGSRAAAYSQNFLGGEKAKMNLVVEEMIEADYAGVMFTTDPSKEDCALIEAVRGKGEQLVSGESSAYRYSVAKSGFEYVAEDGGVEEGTLKKIYEGGLSIAKVYGAEADLEWVVDKEGRLYWLQLRPITALNSCDVDEFNPPHSLEKHLLTSRNIGEMMPGSVTPLSISTSLLAIDYGMRNMLSVIGAIKSVDSKPDYYASLAVKYHLFIDMTALHIIGKKVMMASNDSINLSIMGEHIESPDPEGKKANFLVKMINGIKFAKYLFSSKKAKKNIVALNEGLMFSADGDAQAIYDEITEKLPAMNEALCNHYVCSSFSGAMNSAIFIILGDSFEDKADYQNFVSALLSDIDGIESADILQSLGEIASAVLSKDANAAALSDEELLRFVTDEHSGEAARLYREFLAKHGHRSIKEAELRSKAWKNDPASLMKNLRTVMLSDESVGENKKPFEMDELLKSVKRSKRSAIKWVGKNARQAVRDREFSKSNIIKIIDKFNDRYSILAKILVENGLLSDEDSIYFLTHAEIGKLLKGDTSLKRKALSRREVFRESEELSFDDVSIGEPKPIELAENEAIESLKGISVCRGKRYGRAKIVKTFDDAQKIEKGEIMVAPFTDIGWSPYYSVIGALVTEVGSTLSHGAVVAREYCLPTIVNVKNATKLIHNGDYLCVDASAGVVNIISKEEYEKRTA